MGNRYKDRETLKSYFQRGDVPTEEQFAELIDSVPNIHEDGQAKVSPADGIRLFPSDKDGVVATVFSSDPEKPGPRKGTAVETTIDGRFLQYTR